VEYGEDFIDDFVDCGMLQKAVKRVRRKVTEMFGETDQLLGKDVGEIGDRPEKDHKDHE
jgi:hypothetical protein